MIMAVFHSAASSATLLSCAATPYLHWQGLDPMVSAIRTPHLLARCGQRRLSFHLASMRCRLWCATQL